jgi:hypothetical protein
MRGTRHPRRFRGGIVAAVLLAGTGVAAAQGVPAAGREPAQAAVDRAEAARGLDPGPAEVRREATGVDRVYRELTGRDPNAPAPTAPLPAYGSPAQDAREQDRLYRELTGRNPDAAGPLPQAPSYGSVGQDARRTDQLYRELTGQSPTATPR